MWEEANVSEMAREGCFLNTFPSDYGRVPSSRWSLLETNQMSKDNKWEVSNPEQAYSR